MRNSAPDGVHFQGAKMTSIKARKPATIYIVKKLCYRLLDQGIAVQIIGDLLSPWINKECLSPVGRTRVTGPGHGKFNI